MSEIQSTYAAVIDAMSAHIALLDVEGEIVAVNQAWRRFSEANHCNSPDSGIGCNYLGLVTQIAEAVQKSDVPGDEERRITQEIAFGLREVLAGNRDKFQIEYPCHAPWEERWFLLTITPFPTDSKVRAVVAHENITPLKLAEREIRERGIRLAQAFQGTIEAIALAIEKRDPYTAGHQRQVAALALDIGRQMDLDEDRLIGLHLGAMIHDIGKIAVPAEILSRPGALSEPEFAIIHCHSQIGYDIVHGIDFPWPIAEMIAQHHERLDGSGYPKGLKGDAICLEARIIAVADVFDAIISHRPYRPGHGQEKAVDELLRGRGLIYDADVVDAAVTLIDGERDVRPARKIADLAVNAL